MKNVMKLMVLSAVVISAWVFASADIESRIKPVGEVCMAGDECAKGAVQVAEASGPRSGQAVYDAKCAMCHASGAAGAPKMGDVAAWAARTGGGMDVVYSNAINGVVGMPAKGLCFDCSNEEISAAVDYMVDGSK